MTSASNLRSGSRNETTAPGWDVCTTPLGSTTREILSAVAGHADSTRAWAARTPGRKSVSQTHHANSSLPPISIAAWAKIGDGEFPEADDVTIVVSDHSWPRSEQLLHEFQVLAGQLGYLGLRSRGSFREPSIRRQRDMSSRLVEVRFRLGHSLGQGL